MRRNIEILVMIISTLNACSSKKHLQLDAEPDPDNPFLSDFQISLHPIDSRPADLLNDLSKDYDAHNGLKTLWVTRAGGEKHDVGYPCVMLDSGEVFISGEFQDKAYFGNTVQLSVGKKDIYVSKLNAAGQFVWAQSVGSVDSDSAGHLGVDGAGNVYFTGGIAGQASFGSTILQGGGSIGVGPPKQTVFVSKIDALGTFLWATSTNSLSTSLARGIAVDAMGNSFITGEFKGKLEWGSKTLRAERNADVFIVRLDSGGNLVWAVSGGGSSYDVGRTIGLDSDGNSYVVGYSVSSTLEFGPLISGSLAGNTLFVTKLDSAGKFQWVSPVAQGSFFNVGGGAVDPSGNIRVRGHFFSTTTFDNFLSTSNGGSDFFIEKISPTGEVVWVETGGALYNDTGLGVAMDALGNSYLTGSFKGQVKFGSFILTSVANSSDVFVAKYDKGGNILWAVSAGGDDLDCGGCITVDSMGNVLVVGGFYGTASFGSQAKTSWGDDDIFAWKFVPPEY